MSHGLKGRGHWSTCKSPGKSAGFSDIQPTNRRLLATGGGSAKDPWGRDEVCPWGEADRDPGGSDDAGEEGATPHFREGLEPPWGKGGYMSRERGVGDGGGPRQREQQLRSRRGQGHQGGKGK